MSHRRQWNLYVYSLDTASGAAYNKPLTETDRQTPRLDRTGAGKRKLSQEDKMFLTFYFFVWRRWRHNLSCYQMDKFAMWEMFALCNPWSTGALDKEADTIGWRETENRPSLRQEFPHGAPKPAETAMQLTARPPLKSHSESSSKRIRSSIYTPQVVSPNGQLSRLRIKDTVDTEVVSVWGKIGDKQRKRISEILHGHTYCCTLFI